MTSICDLLDLHFLVEWRQMTFTSHLDPSKSLYVKNVGKNGTTHAKIYSFIFGRQFPTSSTLLTSIFFALHDVSRLYYKFVFNILCSKPKVLMIECLNANLYKKNIKNSKLEVKMEVKWRFLEQSLKIWHHPQKLDAWGGLCANFQKNWLWYKN